MLSSSKLKRLMRAQASLHRLEAVALTMAQSEVDAIELGRRALVENLSGENPMVSAAVANSTGDLARMWIQVAEARRGMAQRAEAMARQGVLLKQIEQAFQSRQAEEQRQAESRMLHELMDVIGAKHISRATQA